MLFSVFCSNAWCSSFLFFFSGMLFNISFIFPIDLHHMHVLYISFNSCLALPFCCLFQVSFCWLPCCQNECCLLSCWVIPRRSDHCHSGFSMTPSYLLLCTFHTCQSVIFHDFCKPLASSLDILVESTNSGWKIFCSHSWFFCKQQSIWKKNTWPW